MFGVGRIGARGIGDVEVRYISGVYRPSPGPPGEAPCMGPGGGGREAGAPYFGRA